MISKKHINISYKDFIAGMIINESVMKKILYHGSSRNFNTFKESTCFFSETPEFAINYANQKSMDYGNDDDTILYTVEIKCNIFDINNKEDYNKIKNKLPETNKIYNNFGMSYEISKKEYLLNLSGYVTRDPIDNIENIKIGDTFPDPHYKYDKFKVLDMDDDFLYCVRETNYIREIYKTPSKYNDDSKKLYDFLYDYIKTTTDTKHIGDDDIQGYYHVFINEKKYLDMDVPPKDKIIEFQKLHKEYVDLKTKKMLESGTSKFIRKTKIEKSNDTWRYYENIITEKIIEELGYDGYVALEKGHKTYAIFNPSNNVKIIDKK